MAGVPYNRTMIISNALILMGKPAILSIDAGGPVAQSLNQIYDMLMAAELSSPNWRFATSVIQLSQLAGVNPNYKGYSAAYQRPPQALAIWQIWPQQPYEIYGEQIWTYGGQSTIQCEFRELGTEAKMPSAFINYFCWVMAYNGSLGVTEHEKIIARLEQGMNQARARAMNVVSQERPNKSIQSSPWIQNRGDGFGWYYR